MLRVTRILCAIGLSFSASRLACAIVLSASYLDDCQGCRGYFLKDTHSFICVPSNCPGGCHTAHATAGSYQKYMCYCEGDDLDSPNCATVAETTNGEDWQVSCAGMCENCPPPNGYSCDFVGYGVYQGHPAAWCYCQD